MSVLTARRVRTPWAIALAVVCVALAALLAWSLVQREAAASAGGLDEPEARERVMSVTDQFVKRLGSYGPDMLTESGEMPDYREQVREVITPKFAVDFDKQVTTAEQLVAQAGVTRTTEVFATAVSAIDDDSATVLVAGAFNDTYSPAAKRGEAQEINQEPYPFRFTVDLVLVDGDWLVDDFSGVNGAGAQEGAAQ